MRGNDSRKFVQLICSLRCLFQKTREDLSLHERGAKGSLPSMTLIVVPLLVNSVKREKEKWKWVSNDAFSRIGLICGGTFFSRSWHLSACNPLFSLILGFMAKYYKSISIHWDWIYFKKVFDIEIVKIFMYDVVVSYR